MTIQRKKATFSDQRDEDENPRPLSFRDKLMEDQNEPEEEFWVEKKTWN